MVPRYTLKKSGEEKDTDIIAGIPRTPLDRKILNFDGDCIDPLAHAIVEEALEYCLETSAKRIESMGKIFPTVAPTGNKVLSMIASIYDGITGLKECAAPIGTSGYHYPGEPPQPMLAQAPVFTAEVKREEKKAAKAAAVTRKAEAKKEAGTKAPTAEPWQLTLENLMLAYPTMVRQDVKDLQLASIKKAIAEGKRPVKKVLDDYPEIASELAAKALAAKEAQKLEKKTGIPAELAQTTSRFLPVYVGTTKYDSLAKAAEALKVAPVIERGQRDYVQALMTAGYIVDSSKSDRLTLTPKPPAPAAPPEMPAGWNKENWDKLTPEAKVIMLKTTPKK